MEHVIASNPQPHSELNTLMSDKTKWLPDLAALASLSVALHYFLGLYGLLGALLIIILLECGAKQQQSLNVKGIYSTSGQEDDASTEEDDEVLTFQETPDEKQRDNFQRSTRVASLNVRDVGSSGEPFKGLEMNSRTPTAFETELFVGRVLFLVRTQPDDPLYANLFTGKRRMFWIQIQGRFKKAPKGTVYLGGELPAKIAPGLFTRSVALVIMGLVKRLVGQVNFSFGGSTDSKNSDQLPAVAFPLYQSVDQFVETPESQVPPVLGTDDFGENEELRRQRRLMPLGAEKYIVGPTYTFDFHTMYVDLAKWETANLPNGLNAINLASFFDSLPLRLVAYEVNQEGVETFDVHRQRDKDYLFSFEVKYDKYGREHNNHHAVDRKQEGDDGGQALTASRTRLSLMSSDLSTMSTTRSEISLLTEEDSQQAQEHASFLQLEHARRLKQLSFSYLCWMEEVDVALDVRRVHYIFAIKDKVGEYDSNDNCIRPERLAIVSSYELRHLLQGRYHHKIDKSTDGLAKLRFHSRSRIGSYSTILTEALQVVLHLESLALEPIPQSVFPSYSGDWSSEETLNDIASRNTTKCVNDRRLLSAQAALYKCFMKRQCLQESSPHSMKLSPSRIGVNLSRRDRQDMAVIFEGVVYRFYATEFLRQEVLLLTNDELLFYRSYASNAEKKVSCSHIIGARAVEMPSRGACGDSGITGAFAMQISTFTEEIVLCVGTSSTRDAWMRGILQHCDSKTNFERAQQGEMYIGFAAITALRPANRVELNSRLLFPRLRQQRMWTEDARHHANDDFLGASDIPSALKLVDRTLASALHILNNTQQLSVTDVLAFLDDASALRAVDLRVLQDSGSHEEQITFYLNLYHTVLAHAMIVQGFPCGKSQWSQFLTRSCYALGHGRDGEQVSLSLAEIEHVILRARLPRAELPYMKVASVVMISNGLGSRLHNLGIRHPDFRLSLALVLNHMNGEGIVIYDARKVHEQLNATLRSLLKCSSAQGGLTMNEDSNTLMLPRVCKWYGLDFGGAAGQQNGDLAAIYCARKLLGFMDGTLQMQVIHALSVDDASLRIKFRSFEYTPKTTLVQDTSAQIGEAELKN
ncbi:hypothetical protein CCR75_004316 [Bremia lactucae]|uniref:PH domain-containing protein n=1 Tax=Bremia lactucae TaxID=4779 RepID=A0A976FLD4_BRELC|nr:hypothetical protein CCR75_004316 [Bremia lactucae]